MKIEELIKFVDNFKDKKIGVIGDLILDKYIYGDVERISPEAPIPVVLVSHEFFTPGGAGNVANNIAALGGDASIIGIIGDDTAGEQMLYELKNRGINTEGIIKNKNQHTTEKIRVMARGQHVVRIDKESSDYTNKRYEKRIVDFITSCIDKWDCIVVSDYAKGLVTSSLTRKIVDMSKKYNKYIVGDTKPLHANYFKNVYLLTPNLKETREITGMADVNRAGRKIQKQLKCNVLVTQGAKGMTLFEGKQAHHFPTKAKEVFDVAGAGDTVVGGVALSLAAGLNLEKATIIANHAAGIVVGKVGTATVSVEELKNDLRNNG